MKGFVRFCLWFVGLVVVVEIGYAFDWFLPFGFLVCFGIG